MFKRTWFIQLMLFCLSISAFGADFIHTRGKQFIREGKPYYFVGTNLWYGPIIGSEGQGGNRARLLRELDSLKVCGIDNLRILVGADAGSKHANTVQPYLQPEPGVLNDTLLAGLDFLMAEMGKRDMVGVLYLTNSWDWSGGYGFYLKNNGFEDSPNASGEGYNDYVAYASQFVHSSKAIEMYHQFVERIITRTNRYTGKAYKDDPAIMSWQICNEPRPFARDAKTKDLFYKYISSTARLIKRLDANHMVSTGSEGLYGCEVDEELCTRVHNDLSVDYLTVHIWPVNWGWASRDRLYDALPNVYVKANEYIDLHVRMAERIVKPMVIEEFGYSRDQNMYSEGSATLARDSFYDFIFSHLLRSKQENGVIAGCNFWGWGGEGRPNAKDWKPGDDFLGDPPHEPQGWYSVYNTDSTTIDLVKKTAKALKD